MRSTTAAGPGIARHELRRLLRSRPATGALLGGLAIMAVLLVLAWPAAGIPPTERGAMARELFRQLLRSQLIAFALGAPLLVAGRVVADGLADDWELVRTTPLGLPALVRAKSHAALGLLTVLALALLPLWGACVLLGGVDPASLLGAILLVLGSLGWVTGAGLVGAAVGGRAAVAATGALALAVPGAAAALWAAPWATSDVGHPVLVGGAALLVGFVAVRVAGWLAGGLLARAVQRRASPLPRSFRRGWAWSHVGRLLLGPRPVADWPERANPFLMRETLADLDPRAAASVGLIMIAAVFAVGGLTVRGVLEPTSDAWLLGVVAGSGTLTAMVAAAQMLPTERERGTLDLLRTIPRATLALPWGKAAAAVRLGARVTLALGAFALPGPAIHLARSAASVRADGAALPHLGWLLLAEVVFAGVCVVGGAGVGVVAGAWFRTATGAMLGAAAMLAALMGLPAIVKAAWIAVTYPGLSLYEVWTHLGAFVVLAHPEAEATDAAVRPGVVALVGPDPGRLLGSAVVIGLGGGAALVCGLLLARRELEAER